MTNKRLCLSDGNKEDERQGGEDNQETTSPTATVMHSETDTCPICLSCLLEQELGFPENCHHVFCMTCILKWADIVPFCPVDRKPFQAVYRFEDHVKFQVAQNKTTHEKGSCTGDQNSSFTANRKCYIRDASIEPLKPKVFNGFQRKHDTSRTCENEKKMGAVKPRTASCASRCYRNDFNHVHNSGIITGDYSSSYTNHSHDMSEFYATDTVIQRKTQTLRSLWSSAVQLRIDGISCTAADIAARMDPSTAVLRSRINFPVSHAPSDQWDSSSRTHIPMCAQDGVEKKKAGASSTRGARKTPENTPTRRRSTRNSRSESTNQASSPPRSSNSGSNAPEGQASSLNTSSADSEKRIPKQSSKKEVKKQLPRKKRLRSSVCDPDDSSSSEVTEEDASETRHDIKPDLEKKPQSSASPSHESDKEMSCDLHTPTLEKKITDASANKSSDADMSGVLVNKQLTEVAGSQCSLPASVKELLPGAKEFSACFSEKEIPSVNEETHASQKQSSHDEHLVATPSPTAQKSHLEHVSLSPSDKDEPNVQSSVAMKAQPPADDGHILAAAEAVQASPVLKKEELPDGVCPLASPASEKEEQFSIFSVLEKEQSNLEQSPAPPCLEKESQPDTEHPPRSNASAEGQTAEHNHGSPVLEKEQSVEYSKEAKKEQSDCELSPAPPALEKEHVELSPVSPISKRSPSDSLLRSVSPTLEKENQSDIDLSPAPPALEKEQQSEHTNICSAFERDRQSDGTNISSHATEKETPSDIEHSPAPPALEKELQLEVDNSPASPKEQKLDFEHALPSAFSAKEQQLDTEDLPASLVALHGPVSDACSSLPASVKEPQSNVKETLASVLSTKEKNQADVANLLASPVEQSNDYLAPSTPVKKQLAALAPDVEGKSHPELTPSDNKQSDEKVSATESQTAKSRCPLPTNDIGVEITNQLLECKEPGKSEENIDDSGGAIVSLATVNQTNGAKSTSKRLNDFESPDVCTAITANANRKDIPKSNLPRPKSFSSQKEPLEDKPDTEHEKILNMKVTSGTDSDASESPSDSAKLNPPVVLEHLSTNIQAKNNEPPVLSTKKRRKFFSEDNDQMVPLLADLVSKPDTEQQLRNNVKPEIKSLANKTAEKTALVINADCKDEAKSKDSRIIKALTTEGNDKKKEARPRRSRFHSPSTTWSPESNTGERKRSTSPNRGQEPSPKHRARSRSREKNIIRLASSPMLKSRPPNKDTASDKSEQFSKRKSRSRSKDGVLDKNVSSPKRKSLPQSKDSGGDKEPTSKRHSRSPSKDQGEKNERWKDWNRDRRSRQRSRSDSLPRSRSRSRSRNRTGGMSGLLDHNEKETPAALLSLALPLPLHPPIPHSHQWDRWSNDNWRGTRGKRYRRNEYDYENENFRHESNDFNRDIDDSYPQYEGRNEYPDWVMDRRSEDHRSRDRQQFRGSQWEDNRYNTVDTWSRNSNSGWNSSHNHGGRSKFVESFDYGHQSENRWRCREPLSGDTNNSENESSGVVENRPYGHKNEKEYFEAPPDRSGWTSASSWAVRKTLPADVQNYYSKRGKDSSTPQREWTEPDSEYTAAESEYTAAEPEYKVADSEYAAAESEYTTSETKHTEPEPEWTSSEPEWTVRKPELVAQESEWTTTKPEWTPQEPEWAARPAEWTEPQAEWTEPQAEWTEPQAEWTEPQAEWTEPQAEWTEPQAEWTEPQAEWTEPQAEWTEPQAKWTEPQAKWTEPQAEWTEPQSEWTEPQSEWTKPQSEWTTPHGEWTRTQPDWTKPPPDWTKPPPDWTKPPPDWTKPVDETPEQDRKKSAAKEDDMKEPRAGEGKSWIKHVEPILEEQRNVQDECSKIQLEMLPPPPPPPPQMNIIPPQINTPHQQHVQPQMNMTHQSQAIQPQTNTAHHPVQTQMNQPHHPVQQQITMPHHTTQPQMNASHQSIQPQINTPPQPIQQQMNAPHQPMQHLNAPYQPMQRQVNTLHQPMQQQINAPHQPMNIFPYPIGVHAPMMNIQHNPYTIPPPLHMQLPPGVPLIQVASASTAAQELPPPPPPPPPPQVNYSTAQPEGKKLLENIGQVRQITLTPVTTMEKVNPNIPLVSNNMLTLLLPATSAAVGNTGAVAGSSSSQAPLTSQSRPSNTAKSLAGNKVSSSAPHVGSAKSMSNLPPPAPPVVSKGNVRGPTSSKVSSANHSNLPPVATVAAHKVNSNPLHVSNSKSMSHVPPPPPAPPVGNRGAVQGPSSSSMSASSHNKHAISSMVSGQKIIPNAPHVSNPMKLSNVPAQSGPLSKVTTVQGPSSSNTSHPNTSKPINAAAKMTARKESIAVETRDDGYQVDKKVQIQERAAYEVKVAIKPYYQSKDITKDEYKEIVRKAVDKVCHSKSGDVNSAKVANLVRAYVDKYKHARKEKE